MKIFQIFKNLFLTIIGRSEKIVINNADEALAITSKIKDYLSSPLGSVLVTLIPGTFDDSAREIALKILDKVIPELIEVQKCASLSLPGSRYQCYLEEIKKLSGKMQNAFLLKLASVYLLEKYPVLKEHEADSIIQGRYIQKKSDD